MPRPHRGADAASALPVPAMPDVLPEAAGYEPGGSVGQMHAELADRLLRNGMVPTAKVAAPETGLLLPLIDPPGERIVRFVSVAGGWLVLAAACAGIAVLILR